MICSGIIGNTRQDIWIPNIIGNCEHQATGGFITGSSNIISAGSIIIIRFGLGGLSRRINNWGFVEGFVGVLVGGVSTQ